LKKFFFEKALLIDDDSALNAFMATQLRQQGIQVDCF
jgi:DNA-binding response OmpR family regulator